MEDFSRDRDRDSARFLGGDNSELLPVVAEEERQETPKRCFEELISELKPLQQTFVLEYLSGEDAGNGTKCYQKVYSTNTEAGAAASASYLLTTPKVRAVVEAFQAEARAKLEDRLIDWMSLVPTAQRTVLDIAEGRITKGAATRLNAARELLDRALGRPTERRICA